MLTLHTKLDHAERIDARLMLPYHLREKSRLRATLDNGEEVAILTVRGTVLRGGDLISSADGYVALVVAAPEPTYRVSCHTAQALLRCAFHLGNRHTQAEVGDGFLRIRKDAVLKEMLEGLAKERSVLQFRLKDREILATTLWRSKGRRHGGHCESRRQRNPASLH